MNRRGRALSDVDREEIVRLCGIWEKPTAGKVAQRLGKKTGTVYWFMLTRGLVDTKPKYIRSYERYGQAVRAYTAEEDAMLLSLRAKIDRQGRATPYRIVAEKLTAAFGKPRTAHSVQTRNVILSTRVD